MLLRVFSTYLHEGVYWSCLFYPTFHGNFQRYFTILWEMIFPLLLLYFFCSIITISVLCLSYCSCSCSSLCPFYFLFSRCCCCCTVGNMFGLVLAYFYCRSIYSETSPYFGAIFGFMCVGLCKGRKAYPWPGVELHLAVVSAICIMRTQFAIHVLAHFKSFNISPTCYTAPTPTHSP